MCHSLSPLKLCSLTPSECDFNNIDLIFSQHTVIPRAAGTAVSSEHYSRTGQFEPKAAPRTYVKTLLGSKPRASYALG